MQHEKVQLLPVHVVIGFRASTSSSAAYQAVELQNTHQRSADVYYLRLHRINASELSSLDQEIWEGYAAENLTVTRQMTFNLLALDTSVQAGIKNKRKTCGWDENYMMKLLGLINS